MSHALRQSIRRATARFEYQQKAPEREAVAKAAEDRRQAEAAARDAKRQAHKAVQDRIIAEANARSEELLRGSSQSLLKEQFAHGDGQ